MKKNIKLILLLIIITLSTACSLPYQSSSYPMWTTNGIIDSETLDDGRIINGYQYLKLNNEIETSIFKIKVTDVKTLNEYNNYIPEQGNHLVVANVEIENLTNKYQYVYINDFPLMWNLNKEEQNYTYSISSKKLDINIITDKTVIITKTNIILVYEINDKEEGPFAINYQEVFEDDLKGVSYYFYLQ